MSSRVYFASARATRWDYRVSQAAGLEGTVQKSGRYSELYPLRGGVDCERCQWYNASVLPGTCLQTCVGFPGLMVWELMKNAGVEKKEEAV